MGEISCISPVDGSVYATRPTEAAESVRRRLGVARAAQKAWAERPLAERVELVREGVARLDRVNADLVTELAWQMGRPVRYGGEMGGVRERTAYMAGIAERALAPEVIEDSDKFRRVLAREPVGIVFVIAPWNYPFLTAINTIVPALIAGNAVALKHASQTPLAGERLAQAFAHLPEGLFTNLFLDHATTSELIAGRAFDFINFTGSVRGGQEIERAAAGTFVGTGLELGGKDPGYVRADANLDAAVDVLMDGAMYNAGQCCCGIERIYVHASLYDGFVAKAVDWVSKLTARQPAARRRPPSGRWPRSASPTPCAARPPRRSPPGRGRWSTRSSFPPTPARAPISRRKSSSDVDHSMRVMTEESFGPVVGIMPVRDDEEAIRLMNDCRYGLTASVWTGDTDARGGDRRGGSRPARCS